MRMGMSMISRNVVCSDSPLPYGDSPFVFHCVRKVRTAVLYFRIRSDPDLFDQIRILELINYPKSTFFVCVKATNTYGISIAYLFDS
jgi:hypothetical protein